VIVGTFVFRRKAGMEVTKAEYATQWYSPVWYSLGLFLPVVDLEMSKVWRPGNDSRWTALSVLLCVARQRGNWLATSLRSLQPQNGPKLPVRFSM
jgi:hypothetical protein